jgi:dephospho-CoA kinase
VDILIRRSQQKVIVIEAIKLLEAGLAAQCDAVWVTFAPKEVQLTRLMQKRGLSETAAGQRIQIQPPQEEKIARANIIIRSDDTFDDTWKQVVTAWQRSVPDEALHPEEPVQKPATIQGEMVVQRARPSQAAEIAALINRLSEAAAISAAVASREDVMAAFGEKAFLILKVDGQPVGLAGWKVENLVACTGDVFLEKGLAFENALRGLMSEIERSSKELQCEISLLFLPPDLARQERILRAIGYQPRTIQSLGVRAWQEAAMESIPPGATVLFKQLRKDRVLRPV